MNFKTTFVLLILVVIGGALWFSTGERPPATEETGDEQPAAATQRYVLESQPEANDMVRLQIERRDKPTLVFTRQPTEDDPEKMDNWRMVEPLESRTENYMVNGIVTMLTGLQYRRAFQPGAGGASLADAGLEPPAGKITIADKEGTQYAVEIGKQVALSNDMYVRLAGSEEILVIGRDVTRDLKRDADDFRAKALLKFTAGDVKHLHVDYEGTAYDFALGSNDQWVINEPVKAYAQTDKVKALIDALAAVRVEGFVDDAPASLADFGLDAPALTVSVTTEKQKLIVEEPPQPAEGEEPSTQPVKPRFEKSTETFALVVGEFADLESSSRYVKLPDQPWVASATQAQLDKLIPKLSDLRDPRITRVKAGKVTRLDITAAGSTTTLEKQDGKWTGTGDLAQLDTEAVTKVLTAFEDASAIDFIDRPQDLAEYGLDQPRAILAATTADAVEPVMLHIGADTQSGHNTFVQVAGQPTVMVIRADRAGELAVKPISLRSREITSGTPGQIKRVDVQLPEKRYTLELEEDGSNWRMLEPADAPPDPGSVRELVNDLSRLRAKQVVAKDADEAYGLTTPVATIQFEMEQPVEGPPPEADEEVALERVTHTLLIGRANDLTYARIDDDPYVFELDQTVFEVLTAELIRRGLFDLEGDVVTYLKIDAPGGTVEFQREDGKWTYPPDKFLELSQKKVGEFVTELAELRVNAYMAYRDGDLAKYGLEEAPVTVTMRLEDESAITLKIDQVRRGELPRKAAWVEQRRVFLLRPAEAEKLMRGLDYYVKPEPTAEDTGPQTP